MRTTCFPHFFAFVVTLSFLHAQNVDTVTNSFVAKYWSKEKNYLQDHYPANGKLTQYWTYAQGFDAILDASFRNSSYMPLVFQFYYAQEKIGWDRDYYDDLNWMALALLRAYKLTNTTSMMERSLLLYEQIRNAWDTTCCGANKGGIWWDKAKSQKATASNAGPALLSTLLHLQFGNIEYLNFAKMVYSFWWANMVNSTTYQVCDHLVPHQDNVQLVWWKFTYNEGLMIGASVALYRATNDAQYLANAYKIVKFMTVQETKEQVLFDGTNSGCDGDCQEFKGIGFRYLLWLYQQDKTQTELLTVLQASVTGIWNRAYDSATGMFATDWLGPTVTSATQATYNAAAMALNLFANNQLGIPVLPY